MAPLTSLIQGIKAATWVKTVGLFGVFRPQNWSLFLHTTSHPCPCNSPGVALQKRGMAGIWEIETWICFLCLKLHVADSPLLHRPWSTFLSCPTSCFVCRCHDPPQEVRPAEAQRHGDIDRLLLHSLHDSCQKGSWEHHTQTRRQKTQWKECLHFSLQILLMDIFNDKFPLFVHSWVYW